MPDWLFIIIALITALLFGAGLVWNDYKHIRNRHTFAVEYLHKFESLISTINQRQFDTANYDWLTRNVIRMQDEMGPNGLIDYKPPFALYILKNYQILINTLTKMRDKTAERTEVYGSRDALNRHIGQLEELVNSQRKKNLNPFFWLFSGVSFIITLPVRLTLWSGLIGNSGFNRIANSAFIRVITFIVIIIGLLGSVITIALGWDKFLSLF